MKTAFILLAFVAERSTPKRLHRPHSPKDDPQKVAPASQPKSRPPKDCTGLQAKKPAPKRSHRPHSQKAGPQKVAPASKPKSRPPKGCTALSRPLFFRGFNHHRTHPATETPGLTPQPPNHLLFRGLSHHNTHHATETPGLTPPVSRQFRMPSATPPSSSAKDPHKGHTDFRQGVGCLGFREVSSWRR